MNLKDLAKPFPPGDIEWRISRGGVSNGEIWAMVLAYINARAVMDRLDEVCGPGNWKDRYWKEGEAVMCGLSIRVDGEWIEKMDGAEETDIEAVKGGLSGALKRAAVKFGIGRYLYNLEENFANITTQAKGAKYGYLKKENKNFYWHPPELPGWALPEGNATPEATPAPPETAPIQESPRPPVGSKPTAVPSPVVSNDLGSFKFDFGSHVGKTFEQMGHKDVEAWYQSMKNVDRPSTRLKKALDAAEAYLKTREFKKTK